MLEARRQARAAAVVEVGEQEPDQQVLEGRGVVLVAEVARHQVPEGRQHPELLHLGPGRRQGVEVAAGDGVEERDQDVEELRLIGLGERRNDLAVEVERAVVGGDELLQPLQALAAREELGPLGEVLAQRLLREAKVREQHGGAIRTEARAVQPQVEQPVLLRRGRLEGRIEQVAAGRVLLFEAHLERQGGVLVEAEQVNAREVQRAEGLFELALRVVPEDDAAAFLLETLSERVLDAFGFHNAPYRRQVTVSVSRPFRCSSAVILALASQLPFRCAPNPRLPVWLPRPWRDACR